MSFAAVLMATPVTAQVDEEDIAESLANDGGVVTSDDFWGGTNARTEVEGTINLGQRDPRAIAAQVINILLGFLGIIAVIIILAGGFKWMTAGGNQDKVDEAKKLMSAGVVGLIIVLASFGIAQFIINSLVTATTGGSSF